MRGPGFADRAQAALEDPRFRWSQVLPFLGPAVVASVAYMDPGNFATNITGGARYGYALLWVIVVANAAAMFIQYQSAKLGVVTGRNLTQLIRERAPRPVVWVYWVQAEAVAMATDLAEFLGAALALHLLAGLSLFEGALVAGLASFAILGLGRWGFRPLEIAITAFVGVIAGAYALQLVLARPGPELWQGFVPSLADQDMLFLAMGILGATVMPHVIYLHSALTQTRIPTGTAEAKKKMLLFTKVEVALALGLAGLVNLAMLVAAAGAFYGTGLEAVAGLEEAYQTLTPILGPLAAGAFAVALLASGLSSSTVGTLAGQIVMEGFLGYRLPLALRRGLTMVPALVIIGLGVDPTWALVTSQVVLSFGIPFALVPLVRFTGDRGLMGAFANRRPARVAGVVIAGAVIALNLWLLIGLGQ